MNPDGRAEKTAFQQNLTALRSAHLQTLTLVNDLTQQELDRRPDPRKWSIGEVVDHLLLFDGFLTRDFERLIDAARSGRATVIRHSFSDINVAPTFFPRPLLPLVEIPASFASMFVPSTLRNMLARSRLIRFRHPDFADPRRGRATEELRHELRASLEAIEQLLLANTDIELHKLRVQHPLLGDNSLEQILNFMAAHEQRHQGQIKDLKRKLRIDPPTHSPSIA